MLNWLRDPTLYPGDIIREGFARYPTVFWKAVALVPQGVSTEAVLFFLFLVTKFLFFLAIARIAWFATSDFRFMRLTAVLVALTPLLNFRMPFGAVRLLDPIQTHTPLAIAVLLCACAALLEGRWIFATVLTAATIYLSVPYTVYALFAFSAFAVVDFRSERRTVLFSGVLGAILMLPWLVMNLPMLLQHDAPDYVQALLLFYPLHLKWSSHHRIDFVYGPLFLLGVLVAALWAHKKRLALNSRLETMAAAFFVPVTIGVVVGQIHLTPLLARMQLMRADALLFLFSALLLFAAVYGMALNGLIPFPAATLPVAFLVFLLPRTPLGVTLLIFGLGLGFWGDCRELLGRACIYLGGHALFRGRPRWIARVSLVSVILAACLGLLGKTVLSTAFADQFSIPEHGPDNWDALQIWARNNTPRDATFLVPTFMEGFRVLSERSSWGEWKDGTAVYLYPPFADGYISRMKDVGWSSAPDLNGRETVRERYKTLPWQRLLALARNNHLQYVVQYRDVSYPDAPAPVYTNPGFAAYKVEP
ncbi:MAG TPA: DUF6798 domain-containing protein [Candidatus Aquilonibacter sp.]|nr:DUF6798 domain-containing protein [Candidatus Aquilonibacter sp.]